jgi:hypothetical protein
MTSRVALATMVAAAGGCAVVTLSASQGPSLRDLVRQHGDITPIVISCGPLVGLKEIVEHTQLTVEGTVMSATSSLTADEDDVQTDFDINVSRVFRLPSQPPTRRTLGPTAGPWPFVADPPQSRPVASRTLRLLLRQPTHGRVVLDGGVVIVESGFPNLEPGQRIIVSAYFRSDINAWAPFGVFEVRDGRVVPLPGRRERLGTREYESVELFAAALADPPPTVERYIPGRPHNR